MPQSSGIRKPQEGMDLPYLLLTLLLTAVGLIMLFSASFPRAYYVTGNSASYFLSQLLFAALGIVAMYLVSRIPYSLYYGASRLLYFSCVALLFALPALPNVYHL